MKYVYLMKFKATNIAGFKGIEFAPNGDNVSITGQNGAGKSTIKKAISWILSGSTSDGEKLIPYDGSDMPYAEIHLSDGKVHAVIAKEIVQRVSKGKTSRTANCYLNGLPVTQKDINEFFEQYVPVEFLETMLNPFSFFTQPADNRRNALIKLFGNVTDEEVFTSDETFNELDLRGLTTEEFIKHMNALKKKYQRDATEIPLKIKVLQEQIKPIVDDYGQQKHITCILESLKYKIMELESQKAEVESQLEGWQDKAKLLRQKQKEVQEVNVEIHRWEKSAEMIREKIYSNERRLEDLREQWTMCGKNTCPTCGQKIIGKNAKDAKDKILAKGNELAQAKKDLQAQLDAAEEKLAELDNQAKTLIAENDLQDDCDEFNTLSRQRDALSEEIKNFEKRNAEIDFQLKNNKENRQKIDELTAQERIIGKETAAVEKQIGLAEKFVRRKMELMTDAINSHFDCLEWKMFETQKNGEIKGVCTATLNGVPYELISKGEKLKCALDVLDAFQKHFGVVLPLIIDDAESYTSNSIPTLPNQLIILSVVEGEDLNIEICEDEGRKTA